MCGIKTKTHFEWLLWHWSSLGQLNLEPTRPNGLMSWVAKCQLHDLVKISVKEAMHMGFYCPACRTTLIATRFWVVMICPIIKCLTVLEFSFILFDLCLFITIFNFILNYVPIVTFWKFTYHKILILLIIFCFIWSYWIIYFLTCYSFWKCFGVLWVNWCQFAVALANKVKIGLAF